MCTHVDDLRTNIVIEAHGSKYSIHPSSTKMYHDLKKIYCFDGIKKDNAEYVTRCPNCQHVKVENLKPGGLTQMIEVPNLKWEAINMDFVVGLQRTRRQHASLWVIVERMTKSTTLFI